MSEAGSRRETLIVGDGAGRRETLAVGEGRPERLDAWLARCLDLSRTQAARLVEQGLVRVGGRAVRKSAPVAAGQRVEVEIPPPDPVDLVPEDIPLAVVHEDDALLVVDK
ncbi:MAG: S4 domain-containing protein, partial [Gammaproteobacteria bacterium]|nr:S4 domain-containing protein [Gammaproteobacteria bacterium]